MVPLIALVGFGLFDRGFPVVLTLTYVLIIQVVNNIGGDVL